MFRFAPRTVTPRILTASIVATLARAWAPRPSTAHQTITSPRITAATLSLAFLLAAATTVSAQPTLQRVIRDSQQRVVKVYGAGGVAGLEGYQSGFLVSPEGHIATVWSYVLDVEPIVVLDDGRRFESKIVGFEPTLELAVLKIEASDLPYFEVKGERPLRGGLPVLAVSNLFGIAAGNEPASVMRGSISAITKLSARRGTFQTAYTGDVLLLDLVANNPGAAGGALVDAQGQLVGMLGKELRDSATGVWLNYALPASGLRSTIGDIIAGRQRASEATDQPPLPRAEAHSLETLGLVLVPDVLEKTPAFVDAVVPESAAAAAGLRADDLLLLVGDQRIDGQRSLKESLRRIDRRDTVHLTVQRGSQILPVALKP
ncbi:S1C family serine protease [Roseimaritima ulvae]|uniref:Serine protease HtrA n=1 Tax=Roseimaritima ulvae TaxID=980254 RepID=A0A5B9QUL1_9BACT|nr:S1C family serine protease [Roseimaritima ulvae]QEG41632.1 Putative serine protease HtrA [Roseimaritima ulvae]